jgi:succinyl-CoA synthetase beta subunit
MDYSVNADGDAMLIQTLHPAAAAQDAQLWRLLPVALACSMIGGFWKYQSPTFNLMLGTIRGHVHCIVRAMCALTSVFREKAASLVPLNPSGVPDEEAEALTLFVRLG